MSALHPFINRILHGDCLEVLPTLPAASVDFVLTDPPYLVAYRPRDGRTCVNDDTAHWVRPAFAELYRVLRPDSFCVSFYGWPQVDVFFAAWRAAGFRPVSHLVWPKAYCSRHGYTRSHHESAYLLAKGKPRLPAEAPPDVLPWDYSGNALHPMQKPVGALRPLIAAYAPVGGLVLDPFAGSGTTAVAAREQHRTYCAIEQDATYWQQAVARLTLTTPDEEHTP
jgi:site-specific DNA-methyltransferase (adenine-specific)